MMKPIGKQLQHDDDDDENDDDFVDSKWSDNLYVEEDGKNFLPVNSKTGKRCDLNQWRKNWEKNIFSSSSHLDVFSSIKVKSIV